MMPSLHAALHPYTETDECCGLKNATAGRRRTVIRSSIIRTEQRNLIPQERR